MLTVKEAIQKIRVGDWTDDFFREIEPTYLEHFNTIRNTLIADGLWNRFDNAFSEWKRPGQAVLSDVNMTQELENNDSVTFVTLSRLGENQKTTLPDFPIDCISGDVRTYIEAVAESYQVPIDMVASFVITIISLCIQGEYAIQVKPDWIEPVNLYCIVVLRPSERKSPTLKETTAPVFKFVKNANECRKADIAEYELKKKILNGRLKNIQEVLAKAGNKTKYTMQDAIECQKELSELEEVTELRLILDDVTPEALVKAMQENNERMGLISAEGGVFGMMAGRYSNNTNIDIFLKSYSGESYSTSRVNRKGGELEHPLLTILLAVQPQIIADIMENKDFRGRGLLARFLYSTPSSMVGKRRYRTKPIDPIIRGKYEQLIKTMLDKVEYGKAERIIKMSTEADELCEQYSQWIETRLAEELEEIEDWAGKMHGNTMRIAAVLHVIKYNLDAINHPLSGETMKEAIRIGKYYLEHSKNAFNMMGLSDSQMIKDARYIISKIDKCDNVTSVTKRELLRKCRRFKALDEMDLGLQILVEHGYIKIVRNEIRINPEYIKWKEQQHE